MTTKSVYFDGVRVKNSFADKILILLTAAGQTYSQVQIAYLLRKDKQQVWRAISTLKKAGLIEEEHKGLSKHYLLTTAGKQAAQKVITGGSHFKVFDRLHNVMVKSEIMRFPADPEWLRDASIWRAIPLVGWTRYVRRGEDVTIEITPENVIFYVHEVWARDADEAVGRVIQIVSKAMRDLEGDYKGLVVGRPEYTARIVKQEHAIPYDPLAVECFKRGVSFQNDRMKVDASMGYPELEFISPNHAQGDFTAIQNFYSYLAESKPDFSNFNRMSGEMEKAVADLQEFVKGGMSLFNMMYAFQLRLESRGAGRHRPSSRRRSVPTVSLDRIV